MGCALPDGLNLKQKAFGAAWMTVENAAPAQLDLAVRDAGWHFMWIQHACSRHGYGGTDESAIVRAIKRVLIQTPTLFNAAELGSVKVSKYLGLHVAKATLHARHIQRTALLDPVDGMAVHEFAPK